MREYPTLKALRAGKTVEMEGVQFRMRSGEIEPGDWYIAERNCGPRLLTARNVHQEMGCIFSEEGAYPYDLGECVRVYPVEL